MPQYRLREGPVEPGTTIGVNEAGRKYHVPGVTISDWARAGEVKVIQPAEVKGQKVLLDECSLQERLRRYRFHADKKGRRLRTAPGSPPPAPPLHTSPRLLGSAAPGGSAPSAAAVLRGRSALPVLSSQEWLGYFITERIKNERVAENTLESYFWAFGLGVPEKVVKALMDQGGVEVAQAIQQATIRPGGFIARFPTVPMGKAVVLAFLHGMQVSQGSKLLAHRVISSFYNWLALDKQLDNSEGRRVIPTLTRARIAQDRRTYKGLTQEQIRAVFKTARNADELAVMVVLYQTGIREGELCSIRKAGIIELRGLKYHLKLHDHYCDILGKRTKTNPTGERIAYLPDSAFNHLRQALLQHGQIYWNDKPLTETRLRDWMRARFRAAGVWQKGLNTHAFRRSYESEYSRNGGNSLYLDLIMGHFKGDMAHLYFHTPDQDALEQALKYAPHRALDEEAPQAAAPVELTPIAKELAATPVIAGGAIESLTVNVKSFGCPKCKAKRGQYCNPIGTFVSFTPWGGSPGPEYHLERWQAALASVSKEVAT